MSRSKKKAIYKDRGFSGKKSYWYFVRGRIKQDIRKIKSLEDKENYEIKNPKSIINDYTYSDYTVDYEHYKYGKSLSENKRYREQMGRK